MMDSFMHNYNNLRDSMVIRHKNRKFITWNNCRRNPKTMFVVIPIMLFWLTSDYMHDVNDVRVRVRSGIVVEAATIPRQRSRATLDEEEDMNRKQRSSRNNNNNDNMMMNQKRRTEHRNKNTSQKNRHRTTFDQSSYDKTFSNGPLVSSILFVPLFNLEKGLALRIL